MTSTNLLSSRTRKPAAVALVAGLVLAAAGLVIQILGGVPGFPPIPPGPIILIVAAAFVVLAPWRWAPIVGLLAACPSWSGWWRASPPPAQPTGWATPQRSDRSRAPRCSGSWSPWSQAPSPPPPARFAATDNAHTPTTPMPNKEDTPSCASA